MNIGIDIDDTISDTYATLFEYAQKYTVEELKREPIIDEGAMTDHFYIEYMHNWTKKEAEIFWEKYYAEILKKVNIKTFAADTIKKLKDEGHKIYLITARWNMISDSVKDITLKWLKDNSVEYDEFFMNVNNKEDLVNEKNIGLFIDDSFKNCRNVANRSNAKVFLMDTKINRSLKDDNIKRVYSWPHVYSLIESIKEDK